MITLFENILRENRIIFVAKKLSKLSECVNAANALLNPLQWQYVFIPVLPNSLLSYCCAPIPFMIGIVRTSLDEVNQLPMEEVCMIDCDKGSFMKLPENSRLFSNETKSRLKDILTRINATCKGKQFDYNIARCFVDLMVQLIGGYQKYINDNSFNQSTFQKAAKSEFVNVSNSK